VTNPPIDSLRETRVMSLKTRLGNLGNVLEEGEHQFDILQLASPILSTGEFIAMRGTLGSSVIEIDATFALADGEAGLRRGIDRIRQESEEAVRAGATHLILTDEHVGPDRVPIPMILATGAVLTSPCSSAWVRRRSTRTSRRNRSPIASAAGCSAI
jgi:glutamate synthase (NADPH/NADH) large chain